MTRTCMLLFTKTASIMYVQRMLRCGCEGKERS